MLRKRLQKNYTRQLFTMVPKEFQDCLKKVLMLNFDEEPPYDYILNCLQRCFENSLQANAPIGPPSSQSCSGAAQKQNNDIENYVFEWNRTLANRVRNALMDEMNFQMLEAVDLKLSENAPVCASFVSRDIRFKNQGGDLDSSNCSREDQFSDRNSCRSG